VCLLTSIFFFPFYNKPIWLAYHQKLLKLLRLHKIEVSIERWNTYLAFGFSIYSRWQGGDNLGQSIGNKKVWCYWEHLGKQIGNFGNTFRTWHQNSLRTWWEHFENRKRTKKIQRIVVNFNFLIYFLPYGKFPISGISEKAYLWYTGISTWYKINLYIFHMV